MDVQQKQHAENQRKLDELLSLSKKQDERMNTLEKKTNQMYTLFQNLNSTSSVMIFMLKGIILVGTAVGIIYGLLKWIKN